LDVESAYHTCMARNQYPVRAFNALRSPLTYLFEPGWIFNE
jgi:hypothetical protein